MLSLGLQAKDKVTGFQGILTAHAKYLTGCDQWCIQPPVKDGSFVEGRWFDEGKIEITGDGINPETLLADKNGCDFSAPIK